MPLFVIRREVPGASREEIDAAAYRAIACAFNIEGLRWVTSYWDDAAGRLFCVYESENAEQLADHARRARIPCDEVIAVMELGPSNYVLPGSVEGAADSSRGAIAL
jgi:hypothetical protein